jgi:hypothetical protein
MAESIRLGVADDGFMTMDVEGATQFELEQVAKAFRVPYWLVTPQSRPSWFRRPIWRLRAMRWGRA